ncbi:MAG: LVIVD repeat-containing protein, partial [Ilumatobacteraceae bacterium]
MAVLVAAVLGIPASALAAVSPGLTGSVSDAVLLSGVTSVATSGTHEYTTASYAGRLTVIDVSNPGSPFISGASASTNNLLNASTVNVAGGYAYVVSKNRNGLSGSGSNDDGTGNSLTILDVASNPAQPTVVGSIRDPVNLFGAYGVAVSGHYAYVAAQGCISGQPCPNTNVGNSFAVVDVSNPANPTIVATLHNNNLPAPWAGTQALDHATAVAISGNYAYVTASYSNRLTVIDISNPLNPTIVASLQDASRLNFDVDVAVQSGYAYVADQASNLGRVAVVDVSSPASPRIVGTVTNSTWLKGAYRVRLRGTFAYVSAVYADTVAAIDISDPTNPRLAGGYLSTATLNRTTGLDLDSSGRYLVASSPYLSTETQPIYPPYPFQSGGPTSTGTITTVNLDPSALSVTITPSSEPAKATTQTTASFAFSTSDAVASVRCALDGAPFTLCTTPTGQSYSGLGLGSHSFTVQATDAAGNTATDSYAWTINASSGGSAPTTPVLDNFNRANGPVGSSWSLIKPGTSFAPMNVSGNAAVDASTTAYAWNYWNPATFGPDGEA